MIRLLRRLFSIVVFVGVGAWLLTGAVDQELALGGVPLFAPAITASPAITDSGGLRKQRSVSACGASSIQPDGRVTVTSCGERLSERGKQVRSEFGAAPAQTIAAPRSESLYQGKQASIRAIRKVFGRRAGPAIRVASCETGGTFYARSVGRAGERGLFQIHPIHFSWAQPARLFDPVWNSRVAYRLSRGGTSWRAWTCQP